MRDLPPGWRPHDGGKMPVGPDAMVRVAFRKQHKSDSFTSTTIARASFFTIGQFDWWRWQSPNRSNDIIAYLPEEPTRA